jgi:hypothetical protein
MAKKERAEKLLTKLEQTSKNAAAPKSEQPKDRRRQALPQPDFTHYKQAHAYPGKEFLFVGHSYNTECDGGSGTNTSKRSTAVANLLENGNKNNQWVTVKDAVGDQQFYSTLSRFEKDWLGRLPDSTLVGPAIDVSGKTIPQSFTVWRLEMRKNAQTEQPTKQTGSKSLSTTGNTGK